VISVKVIAVSLLDVPARKNGDRLIASFDAEIEPLSAFGRAVWCVSLMGTTSPRSLAF
jgi:hypothetical protein